MTNQQADYLITGGLVITGQGISKQDVLVSNGTIRQVAPGLENTSASRVVDASGNRTSMTVEGELNKLASNISIGRDWAGVHYFTDYIESIRMGEQIALGLLEEQKLTFGENS